MIRVDKTYDIVLMHSPIEEITGHWFEMFEYYAYLRAYGYKSCMLFFTNSVEKESIISAFREKYSVEICNEDIVVIKKENLIICPHAICIVCDGNFQSLSRHGIVIVSKKTYGFGCGNVDFPTGDYKNATYLLDKRVYNVPYGVHYVKKIYSDIFKIPNYRKTGTALLYLTKNCRYFSSDGVFEMMRDMDYKHYLIVTPNISEYRDLPNTTVVNGPIKNLFEKFDDYIYTPVPRHFDCSPRFIAECSMFHKNVVYYHINYHDIGLETRIKDIESGACWLKPNDDIIRIIKK